ncbi:hypothetical protein [Pedococcus sp. 5OH_020]|uniref:hypothetical protein n=1 Tax=Pedococcus sp. 5OH_020 TaxID=2989814 RepID=UPI0022EA07F1|nr:hypothetical protein [Pedococcus sp. 5OH_020]
MRRATTTMALVPALLAAVLVLPGASAAAAPGDGTPASTGSSNVVVGGGPGWSGPASRAQAGYVERLTLAPDGSVLVVNSDDLLRVDPVRDHVTVVETFDPDLQHGALDVAVHDGTTYLLTRWGVDRLDALGARSRLLTQSQDPDNAIAVGADGVVWVAGSNFVERILPDGSSSVVPGTTAMRISDIVVTADGTTAYVLDHAEQRDGIYRVSESGVGERVAGTGSPSDGLKSGGQPATNTSMASVGRISLDGNTLTVSSREYQMVGTFPIGGVVSVTSRGAYAGPVDSREGATVAVLRPDIGDQVVRLTPTSSSRLLGVDPAQNWSPDGVLAAEGFTGSLRGAAPIDDTRLVFATASGMVREVDADGRLHTRVTLPPLTTRGKVAAAPDGTAYVVNDAGRVVRVPVSGPALVLPISATASDVEVLPDGRLAIADAADARVVVTQPDGTAAVSLAGFAAPPTDLGLDGSSLLVANDGLRRVGLGGSIDTLLTGGHPTSALRARDGIWTGRLHAPDTAAMVLHPGGGLGALRAMYDLGRQAQADESGDVLVTSGATVVRVTDGAGVPEAAAPQITATPGEGRVTLGGMDPFQPYGYIVRAKRGSQPPRDLWDGEFAGASATVFQIGGTLLVPGEQWTFAVFESYAVDAGPNTAAISWTPGSVATAAAAPDTTPPPLPTDRRLYTDHEQVRLTYQDPSAWWDDTAIDFDHTVVLYSVGTTPPLTPVQGVGLDVGPGTGLHDVSVPNPVRGQDYGLSVFSLDFRGNYSRWSTVARLDFDPPGVVTDVSVSPAFRSAVVTFTPPTDDDYRGVAFTIAPGDTPAALPGDASFFTTTELRPGNLAMGSTYTISIWTQDRVGNVSVPVTRTFRTLLDATPPGAVTGLTAEGGSYSVTARWTNPSDADLAVAVAELVDPATGATTACPSLGADKASCAWRIKGDATRTVRVRAKDVNDNLSDPSEVTVTTLPDSNGTPSVPEPVTWTADGPTNVTVRLPKPDYVDLSSFSYSLRPSGQPTAPSLRLGTLMTSASSIAKSISLPDSGDEYDLFLNIYDLNGNHGEKVLVGVHGGAASNGRPSPPSDLTVTTPHDNTVDATWRTSPWSNPVTEWVATATSGDGLVLRTVRLPGTTTHVSFGDLPGRQSWSIAVYGNNGAGSGTAGAAQGVLVGDSTAPPRVTALASTPAYDTATLRWTNPSAFDFAKVVVARTDLTTGTGVTLYSGTGVTASSTGLVAGRRYTYNVRSFDALGNVSLPTALTTTQTAASLIVPSTIRYGSSVRASGALTLSGKVLTGRAVNLYAQKLGATTWSRVASTTTSSTGTFALTAKPTVNTRYRVGYAGSGTTGGSYSVARTVSVAPVTSITASRTSLGLGGTVSLTISVSPNHAGRVVSLQRWSGTRWVTLTTRTLGSSSTASATIKPTTRGYSSYRWYLPAHTDHSGSVSVTLKVRVW